MKHFYAFLLVAAIMATPAAAQITIDEVDTKTKSPEFKDEMKSTDVDYSYFSLARYKAERAAIRKKRNYLELNARLQGTLTSFSDSWIKTSGGDNSMAIIATLNFKHTFTKGGFFIENKFNGKFGYNRMKVETKKTDSEGNPYTDSEGVWFKNQDEFEISTAPSFKMTKNWSYGMIAKFRSQIARGYKSRTQQEEKHMKSCFMTPGYLDISLGVNYKSPNKKLPFVVNLSPIAMNATYARNDLIRRDNGFKYGSEDPDKTSKYEGGSSIQIDFDRTFGKSKFLRYRTMYYMFYGWITDIGQENKISKYSEYVAALDTWTSGDKNIKDKPRLPIHPVIRWTNTIDIRATKFLSTTFNFELYYNRAQNLDVQTKMMLSVGLTYTFKNK